MKLNFMNILCYSSDWKISKIKSLFKFLCYAILYPELKIVKPSLNCKYIVCPRGSYQLKQYFYEDIAVQLNAGIACLSFKFIKPSFVNYNDLELIFWSGKRLAAIFSAKRFGVTISSVFQHGFFKFSKEMDSFLFELDQLEIESFFIFRESFNEASRKFPAINLIEISPPLQPKRNIVNSTGFATRGPEFFLKDLYIVISSTCVLELVYFHPNYRKLKRFCFIFCSSLFGQNISSGDNKSISSTVLTKSNSFKLLAKEHNVKVV